jgi:glycosyltransferase involved in cell wall biosynthesis
LSFQNNKQFEWVIVDDGSVDETESLISKFIEINILQIKYIKVKNGGKHRAINHGVLAAKGDLFMIIDSDDYMCDENVVASILVHKEFLDKNDHFCAIVGNRVTKGGEVIGTQISYKALDSDFIDYRVNKKVLGDRAEVIKTSVMKEFPFPEFEGENFLTEGIVWNRMALKYKARYINESYIVCEYLLGGLTDSSFNLCNNNPNGVELMYSEASKLPKLPFIVRLKFAFYFWYLSYNSKNSFYIRLKKIGLMFIWLYPFACFVRYIKQKKHNDK